MPPDLDGVVAAAHEQPVGHEARGALVPIGEGLHVGDEGGVVECSLHHILDMGAPLVRDCQCGCGGGVVVAVEDPSHDVDRDSLRGAVHAAGAPDSARFQQQSPHQGGVVVLQVRDVEREGSGGNVVVQQVDCPRQVGHLQDLGDPPSLGSDAVEQGADFRQREGGSLYDLR